MQSAPFKVTEFLSSHPRGAIALTKVWPSTTGLARSPLFLPPNLCPWAPPNRVAWAQMGSVTSEVQQEICQGLKRPDIPGPWLRPPLQPRKQSHQLGCTAVLSCGMLCSFQLQATPLLPCWLGLKAAERSVSSGSWCEGLISTFRGVPRSLRHLREFIHRALSIIDIGWLFPAGASLLCSRSTWSSFPCHKLGFLPYQSEKG